MGQVKRVTVVRLVATGTIEEKIGILKGKKRELAAAVIGDAEAGAGPGAEDALRGLTDADVDVLLGGMPGANEASEASEASEANPELEVARRYVLPREIDELRMILRRIESSGTPRKDLARRVGLPVARVSLLLIGHRVPIPTKAAEKIRALRLAVT
jgi:hypothetical protein